MLQVFLAGVSLLSGGIVCAVHWVCNHGEHWGVAMAATLGGGDTLGGGTTLGGGVTLGSGVAVAGAIEGNTTGVFCHCGGVCGTSPS